MSDILAVLAKNIKFHRKQLNLTQEDLAKRAGVNRSHLAMIEGGNHNVLVETIDRLAQALGMTVSELLKPLDE